MLRAEQNQRGCAGLISAPAEERQMGKTLFDKIWDSHVITDLGSGFVLLHIDRLLLHDLSGGKALQGSHRQGLSAGAAAADLRHARPHHVDQARPHREDPSAGRAADPVDARDHHAPTASNCSTSARTARASSTSMGPEQGLTLPGTHAGLRRQPHLHAWRHGRAGLRHRLVRAGACAGHADHGAAQAQAPARQLRGRAAARRHAPRT